MGQRMFHLGPLARNATVHCLCKISMLTLNVNLNNVNLVVHYMIFDKRCLKLFLVISTLLSTNEEVVCEF